MKVFDIVVQYVIPLVIIGLLVGFIIYASVKKEGFDSGNCKCPSGSMLKNGGCFSCDNGYTLSTDYYHPHCVSNNPNDKGTPNYTRPPIYKSVNCN